MYLLRQLFTLTTNFNYTSVCFSKNRIYICKNIIQSIKDYITTPEKLEPHRAKNHFVRKRKLSLFQVIMYLLYTSKASMFQNLSRIRENLGCLDFPDISKQALSKARQFINPALFKEPIHRLLILDEWLLLKLTEAEARNLFELIHKRRKKSSTTFCSQFRESEWYQQICDGESTLADAIMDRISYDSYKIDIESVDPSKDLSMREVYGLDPAMAK